MRILPQSITSRTLTSPSRLLPPSFASQFRMSTQKGAFDSAQEKIVQSHFEKVAKTYEQNNGGVTNKLALRMIELASSSGPFPVPITASSVIHDNASGPGIIADEIIQLTLAAAPTETPPTIHCTDFSAPMIAMIEAKELTTKYPVEAYVMDSGALTFHDTMFTHSFTSLGIFMLPDPVQGTAGIYRTLKPGGVASVSTIKHPGWLPPYQRAQKRIRPDEAEWIGMLPAEWSTREHLTKILEQGGFAAENVHVEEYPVDFPMATFLTGQEGLANMAAEMLTKTWNDEEKKAFRKAMEEEVAEEARNDPAQMQFWIALAKK